MIRIMPKNFFRNVHKTCNHRETMILSKIFELSEHCLLLNFLRFTTLTNMKIDYIKSALCTLVALVLKETAQEFLSEGSEVYSRYLDL